jgi:protein TonB
MKRKNEKVPGFDEIIFENRNKEYGAYDLRKRYLGTTCLSLLGGVAVSTAIVLILSFTMERRLTGKPIDGPIIIVQPDPTLTDPNKIKPSEPEIPKPAVYKPVYTEPEIVEKLDSNDVGMAVAGSLDSTANRPVDAIIVLDDNPDPVIPVEPAPAIRVEEMPAFPGGDEALLKYIAEKIIYPEEAAANGIQGRVTLRFVVASDGSVKQVEILRGVHPDLDKEAIRVISLLPKWKPGKQNGIAVPVFFSVPVNFKLKFN